MSTEAKCNCQHCSGHISFPTELVGQTTVCPHCGLETKLYVPAIPQDVRVEIKRGANPLGIASLVFGIMGGVICWVPILGLFAIPVALIGLVLAFIGIVMAATNKKTGFVFSISGGIVCILSMSIALVSTGAVAKIYSDSKKTNQTPLPTTAETSNQRSVASSPAVTSSLVAPSNSEWTQSRSVKQGDIQVTLIKTHIETQRSVLSYDPRYKDLVLTNGFAVEIEITNSSPSKIVRGKGWSGENNITLTDNFGNKYPQNTYRNPDPRWPSPPLMDEFTLYPNQSTRDFMRFDKLVKNIEWLHLELPADNFGGSGVIRFEIPASQINIQWPPPY